MVFFGADKIGNMIILCVDQNYNLKQSKSVIHIRDPTGLEFTNQGIQYPYTYLNLLQINFMFKIKS